MSLGKRTQRIWLLVLCVAMILNTGVAPALAFSLRDVPVIEPTNLHAFVRGNPNGTPAEQAEAVAAKQKLLVLGKALFWDMQVGSDDVQACATCHFNAGADPRPHNQLNPGEHGTDTAFGNGSTKVAVGAPSANQAPWNFRFGVNTVLSPAQFPFTLRTNPTAPVGGPAGGPAVPEFQGVVRDTNDVASSQGVRAGDLPWPWTDTVFGWGNANQRKVEPRNAPSMINSVFHVDMFWDGRASFVFNGVNPFGFRDRDSQVLRNEGTSATPDPQPRRVRIPFAAHASQSVGPPLSDHEMSGVHRTFQEVGDKLVAENTKVLGKQVIHPDDSVLGDYAKASFVGASTTEIDEVRGAKDPVTGLDLTYLQLIQDTFRPEWWNMGPNQVRENFSLFAGLAMQQYQGTLVADDTPFDRFVGTQHDVRRGGGAVPADPTALTQEQQLGLDIFQNTNVSGLNGTPGNPALPAVLGGCFNCHALPETSNSNFRLSGAAPLDVNGNPVVNFNTNPATGGDPSYSNPLALQNAVLPIVLMEPMPFGAFQPITPAQIVVIESIAGPPDRVIAPVPPELFGVPQWDLTPAEVALILADPAFATFTTGLGFYDVGFYNLGVRPTEEDLGRHDWAPATSWTNPVDAGKGLPLSYVEMADMMRDFGVTILPQDVRAHVPELVPLTTPAQPLDVPTTSLTTPTVQLIGFPTTSFEPITRGAFKVPNLRNQQFMGPYMHTGGHATLRQVIEFYARGGDFPITNLAHRDADIVPIPGLDVSGPDVPVEGGGVTNARRVAALVDFTQNGFTDQRVAHERAPFDHPQLILPEGVNPATTADKDRVFDYPAVGAAGEATPVSRFLDMDPRVGADPSNVGRVSGRVTVEGGTAPANGVLVTAHRQVAGVWEKVGADYTDPGGNYRIEALLPGSYKIRAYDEIGRFVSETYDNAPYPLSPANGVSVPVVADQTAAGINISLTPYGTDTFEPNDTLANAVLHQGGNATQSRTLGVSGDQDWLRIDGRAANTYTFTAAGDTGVDPIIQIRRANGTLVSQQSGANGTATLSYTPIVDEFFYVCVRGSLVQTAGGYGLEVSADDGAPPVCTSAYAAVSNGLATFKIAATDDWAGVTQIKYQLDNGPIGTVNAAEASVDVLTGGRHVMKYWAVDAADNTSVTNEREFYVRANTFMSAKRLPKRGYTRLTGVLRNEYANGPQVPGQIVRLQASSNGRTGWHTVKKLKTSSSGSVSVRVDPRRTTYYRLNYGGMTNTYLPSASSPIRVKRR